MKLTHHAGGGRRFEQCYNAQAVVSVDSLLVVAADVVKPPTTSNSCSDAEQDCGVTHALGEVKLCCGQRLFQRGECDRLCGGGDRAAGRDGSPPHHPR